MSLLCLETIYYYFYYFYNTQLSMCKKSKQYQFKSWIFDSECSFRGIKTPD